MSVTLHLLYVECNHILFRSWHWNRQSSVLKRWNVDAFTTKSHSTKVGKFTHICLLILSVLGSPITSSTAYPQQLHVPISQTAQNNQPYEPPPSYEEVLQEQFGNNPAQNNSSAVTSTPRSTAPAQQLPAVYAPRTSNASANVHRVVIGHSRRPKKSKPVSLVPL